jgi:hypothetical protein
MVQTLPTSQNQPHHRDGAEPLASPPASASVSSPVRLGRWQRYCRLNRFNAISNVNQTRLQSRVGRVGLDGRKGNQAMECIMRGIKFEAREYHSPSRISEGDRGAIWKCYDPQHQPIGYLVATGENCNKPIAYVGVSPGVLLASAPRGAALRPVGFDSARLFSEAMAIATDFAKAGDRNVVDLRHISLKDLHTFPAFLRVMIFKPTNGSERAIRYGFAGAIYRPFRESPREKMGVAMFHVVDAIDLHTNPREWESPYIDVPMLPADALSPDEQFGALELAHV